MLKIHLPFEWGVGIFSNIWSGDSEKTLANTHALSAFWEFWVTWGNGMLLLALYELDDLLSPWHTDLCSKDLWRHQGLGITACSFAIQQALICQQVLLHEFIYWMQKQKPTFQWVREERELLASCISHYFS